MLPCDFYIVQYTTFLPLTQFSRNFYFPLVTAKKVCYIDKKGGISDE